MAVIAYN